MSSLQRHGSLYGDTDWNKISERWSGLPMVHVEMERPAYVPEPHRKWPWLILGVLVALGITWLVSPLWCYLAIAVLMVGTVVVLRYVD